MACPITVSKFVGTVSLGLLTGLSYSTSAITIPSLKLLPTSTSASRCLHEVQRLNRKHALRLSSITNTCLCFAYCVSPPRRQHPYLLWMCTVSTLGAYGLDFFFNRHLGLQNWVIDVVYDTMGLSLGKSTSKKEEDLVVVESEEDVNGESVQREMDRERRMHHIRAWVSGLALSMGIVGLWGDKK
ncbi:uncharacterized protein N7469_010848 [Penicillium citrinum]|uniref:Uncharacterized protein n=1 Tax=Penicillium citrinum TaxID=5077 RepID=A0A9W9TGJ1_PENCI|nr:uncharacterized protein N7469_010848 [Penicillium citrinum]KAJ5221961.1 hypothetical protein N7469_010848 [Penicillium citrinum]KAK5797533.1 hypothetical protein VI817_003824 [Penicillium citrinum]